MMSTILNARPPRKARRPRHLPQFDGLEYRLVLTSGLDLGLEGAMPGDVSRLMEALGPSLTVTDVEPADGAILDAAPGRIRVRYDRPIDPSSLALDIMLFRRDADGSWNDVGNDGLFLVETPDDSGDALVADVSGLIDGRYRIVLSGNAGVTGLDGSAVFPEDQILSEFTVKSTALKLSDPINVGALGDQIVRIAGSIDFASDPNAVKLYRFEVEPGHHYRLGAEIHAQREGSSAGVALSLFDADGHWIAVRKVGRSDAPADPFLFRGLDAGVYYLGVSARVNTPDAAGGYDPSVGSSGIPAPDAPGGDFHLEIVADVADDPVGVRTLRLDRADPSSDAPTGFTVQFAGSIDAESLAPRPNEALKLVDSNGVAWPIRYVSYDESRGSLTFVFDRRLPANRYYLVVPSNGLTDLAGRHPRAAGSLTNTLGTFEVAHESAKYARNNLGTMRPQDVEQGVTKYLSIPAGARVDVRMTVVLPGFYSLDSSYLGGRPTIDLIAPDGTVTSTPTTLQPGRVGILLKLDAGVYTLRLQAEAGRASLVDEWVKLKASLADSIPDNGMGQGPALGVVRLVGREPLPPVLAAAPLEETSTPAPIVVLPPPPAASPAPETPSESGPGLDAASRSEGSGASVAETSHVALGGSILFAATNSPALGQPAAAPTFGVVGPGSESGAAAIASNSAGLPHAVAVGFGESLQGHDDLMDPETTSVDALPALAAKTNGQMSDEVLASTEGIETLLADAARRSRDDSIVLSALRAEPITAGLTGGWVDRVLAAPPEALGDPAARMSTEPSAVEPASTGDPSESASESGEAEASSSVGVGLIAVAMAHCQGKLGRWFERKKSKLNRRRVDAGASGPVGPHRPRRA